MARHAHELELRRESNWGSRPDPTPQHEKWLGGVALKFLATGSELRNATETPSNEAAQIHNLLDDSPRL